MDIIHLDIEDITHLDAEDITHLDTGNITHLDIVDTVRLDTGHHSLGHCEIFSRYNRNAICQSVAPWWRAPVHADRHAGR